MGTAGNGPPFQLSWSAVGQGQQQDPSPCEPGELAGRLGGGYGGKWVEGGELSSLFPGKQVVVEEVEVGLGA